MALLRGVVCLLAISALALGQAVATTPPSESSMWRHYDAAHRFQTSGDLLRAAFEQSLFLADALHYLANGHANTGEYGKAVPLYDEALKLAPNDFALHLDYAQAALDARDGAKVRLLAQQALDLHPLDATGPQIGKAHLLLGHAQRGLPGFSEAVREFIAAMAIDPNFENMHALGIAYLGVPDKENAARIFAEIVSRFGDSALIHMKLGLAYGEAGYSEEAIREFKKAIAKNNELPGAHYSLGASYINKLGESAYPEAEVEFAKELAIQPNDSLSYTQLGSIALSRRKFRDAEIALNHAARLNPRNPDIFLLLGQLYGETGRPADAESALRKAIAKTTDPARNHYDVRRAHYRLGRLLIQNGNAEEGRKEMQIAEELLVKSRLLAESDLTGNPIIEAPLQKPHDAPPADIAAVKAFENRVAPLIARSYSSLGLIAVLGKDYGGAAGYFERAAQWDPALPGLDGNWGRAAFQAQQYAQALGPLSRALSAHPDDAGVRSMLVYAESMAKTGNTPVPSR